MARLPSIPPHQNGPWPGRPSGIYKVAGVEDPGELRWISHTPHSCRAASVSSIVLSRFKGPFKAALVRALVLMVVGKGAGDARRRCVHRGIGASAVGEMTAFSLPRYKLA